MEKLSSLCSLKYFSPSTQSKISTVLGIAGLYFVSKLSFNVLSWMKKNFFSFSQDLKGKYGDGWVVVTGGSEGIGFAFAEEFAKQNFKILLISRSEGKLKKAKTELEQKYPNTTIEYISFDFNKNYSDEEVKDLESKLNNYEDISVLINNVGKIVRQNLGDQKNSDINDMINMNIRSMVFTTKIIVAKMIKREKKSLIVGSGSMSGFYRYATRSIYGSTKVFLEAFLESVHNEYPDKIDCTYFEIGAVESVLNPLKMPFKINTQQLGNTCIKYVGKYSSTTGHVMHEIPRVPYIVLPQWYKDWYANVLTNCNKSVQKH